MIKKVQNMKLGRILILFFVVVTVISSIGGMIGLTVMTNMNTSYTSALLNYGFAQGDIGRLNTEFNNSRVILRDAIIYTGADDLKDVSTRLDQSGTALDQDLSAVQKSLLNQTETGYYNAIKANLAKYKVLRDRVMALSLKGQQAQAQRVLTVEGAPMLQSMVTSIKALNDEKTNVGRQISVTLASQSSIATLSILGIIILAILISIGLAVKLARDLSHPLVELAEAAKKMAQGDLSVEVSSYHTKNEIGQLNTAFAQTITAIREYIDDIAVNLAQMTNGDLNIATKLEYKGDFIKLKNSITGIVVSFNDALTQMSQSSEQVSSGSEQVSNGAQALAQGATEQASSIEELSATITEIASNVKLNATSAADASIKVNHVSSELDVSNQNMQDMIAAMSKISDSSSQIGKIIKAIEDIAFQTNILALNAAVEAARAGAAGKGFAVVADEVRNLASKSAEAANNTTALIENSIREVENGTKIADQTATALKKVVLEATAVSNTVTLISQASNEQANSINQITLGVDQISSVVQTNSATAEESAAASEELSGQAQILKSLVGKFKLKNQVTRVIESIPQPIQDEIKQSFLNDSKY